MGINYEINKAIEVEQFVQILVESGLGERRPIENLDCMQAMLLFSNLTISAWQNGKLVGIARCVTDFHYCCYLSDLAVSKVMQKRGIGKKLIEHVQAELEDSCKIILMAAPDAVEYYPAIGFQKHNSAWVK